MVVQCVCVCVHAHACVCVCVCVCTRAWGGGGGAAYVFVYVCVFVDDGEHNSMSALCVLASWLVVLLPEHSIALAAGFHFQKHVGRGGGL